MLPVSTGCPARAGIRLPWLRVCVGVSCGCPPFVGLLRLLRLIVLDVVPEERPSLDNRFIRLGVEAVCFFQVSLQRTRVDVTLPANPAERVFLAELGFPKLRGADVPHELVPRWR